MLKIKHPILVGGLMWLADAALVGAAVNAGAMAFITSRSFSDAESFRAELRKCSDITGGRPFGVNFSVSRRKDVGEQIDERLRISLEEGVRIFETAGASPSDVVGPIHDGGGIIIHKCPTVRHALAAERAGVDAVGLVGMEEGGHPGANLLPTFVNAAHAVGRLTAPLIIGGGIGSGRQIVAALALGADAVITGSRFAAATEVWAHENYKHRVISADENATLTVLSSLGDTWRVLNNEVARRVLKIEQTGATTHAEFGDLISGARTRDRVYKLGDVDAGMLSLSSAAGFVDKIESVEDIIDRLVDDAVDGARHFQHLTMDGFPDGLTDRTEAAASSP